MNYIQLSNVNINTKGVSNVDTYMVCYNEDQSDLANVQSFVFNNKDNLDAKYSIVKSDMTLLQRYSTDGVLENITTDANNHVYLVSLIDGETNALNETMKHVIKI